MKEYFMTSDKRPIMYNLYRLKLLSWMDFLSQSQIQHAPIYINQHKRLLEMERVQYLKNITSSPDEIYLQARFIEDETAKSSSSHEEHESHDPDDACSIDVASIQGEMKFYIDYNLIQDDQPRLFSCYHFSPSMHRAGMGAQQRLSNYLKQFMELKDGQVYILEITNENDRGINSSEEIEKAAASIKPYVITQNAAGSYLCRARWSASKRSMELRPTYRMTQPAETYTDYEDNPDEIEIPRASLANNYHSKKGTHNKYNGQLNVFTHILSLVKDNGVSIIKEALNKNIIGQTKAKEDILYTLMHWNAGRKDHFVGKVNILMAGPSGSGKTEIVRVLKSVSDSVILTFDASQLTASGYVGADVATIAFDIASHQLILAKEKQTTGLDRGIIVFIDEIDKLAYGRSKDFSAVITDQVQNELLKLLEGGSNHFECRRGNNQHSFRVDTSHVLFILAGAFDGISEVVQQRVKVDDRAIGFGRIDKSLGVKNSDLDFYSQITEDDLIVYGFKPEFVGRVGQISYTEALSESDLLHILTKPEGAIISRIQKMFSQFNINLCFSEAFLAELARKALRSPLGVRGLQKVIHDEVKHYLLDSHLYEGKTITVRTSSETVDDEILSCCSEEDSPDEENIML